MDPTHATTFTFATSEGASVFVHRWLPPKDARGIVVIAHGASEHGARYDHFARALSAAGQAVYASDHRGHGHTAAGRLGWAGRDGWNGTLRDVDHVIATAHAAHPGVPLVLFGHSMGSIVAQRFMQMRGEDFAGVVLSGTLESVAGLDGILALAESAARSNAEQPSDLFGAMFAGFNAEFAPARTGFEWLSRDEREVQKYVDDPLCGFAFSNRMLADFLAGWAQAWEPEHEATIPRTLPVALFSGARDPVGRNSDGPAALAARYRALGIANVAVTLYPEARHEILNELNREKVERDIVAWIRERAG